MVEAAAIRAAMEGAKEVEPQHLFPESAKEENPGELSFQEATRRYQRKLLLEVLNTQNWNVAETARRLSLARTHVYHLINAFELRREGA